MNMFAAIAHSAGNKARAYNDEGKTVIVQICTGYNPSKWIVQPYGGLVAWHHIWLIHASGEVVETTIEDSSTSKQLKKTYLVDPTADYWQPV